MDHLIDTKIVAICPCGHPICNTRSTPIEDENGIFRPENPPGYLPRCFLSRYGGSTWMSAPLQYHVQLRVAAG